MSDNPFAYGPRVPINNVVIPKEGPRVLSVTMNFADHSFWTIEGLLPVTTGQIGYIQGVYIDNGNNPEQLTLRIKTTEQRLIIPAYGQGYWAVLFAQTPDCVVSTIQADIDVIMHFYNVPIQTNFWLTNDVAPSTGGDATAANQVLQIAQETAINGKLPATLGQKTGANSLAVVPASDYVPPVPIGGAWTNGSIANLSGASQSLFAANANRRHLFIQNIAANNMGVNLAGGAAAIGTAGTITLTPGSALELFNYPPTSAITIIGTVNDDVTAFEG